jgi:arginase family enzyme
MKIIFIPNWNGHLFLSEYEDKSINYLCQNLLKENFNKKFEKKLIEIEKNNISKTNENIEKNFLKYFNEENQKNNNKIKIISITGDHSNSYPLIKTYFKIKVNENDENKDKINKNIGIVIFDAHPDVEVSTDLISHEDYLRNLIENENINPKDIYLFGIRTFSRTELDYLIEKKVNFYPVSDLIKNKEEIIKKLKEIKEKYENIYLSIDIDVLDPDEAPATYYREWCGLKIDELIEFSKIIKDKVECMDITEYYKEKEDENQTTFNNIEKLLIEFLG